MKKTTIKIRILVIAFVAAPALILVFSQWNPSIAQDIDNRNRRPSYRDIDNRQRQANQQQRGNFKSGAQRSEIILKEIAATLKTIDQRLERLEKVAESLPAPSATPLRTRNR